MLEERPRKPYPLPHWLSLLDGYFGRKGWGNQVPTSQIPTNHIINLHFRYSSSIPIANIVFPGPCPELKEISHTVTTRGDFSYISDDIGTLILISLFLYAHYWTGLHRVKAHDEEDTITLHLYSPPITEARILEPTGHTSTRTPGFYSMYPLFFILLIYLMAKGTASALKLPKPVILCTLALLVISKIHFLFYFRVFLSLFRILAA